MRVSPFSVPLARPLETAAGAVERREGFLVSVGEAPPGLGEATPLFGWTEDLAGCRRILDDLAADDPPSTPAALPPMTDAPAARHAVELALLDREAQVAGVPLYRQLGGERRVASLPVNATVGDGDEAATVEAATAAARAGFGTVKLKVGTRPVEADLDRVAAVRDAVGPSVDLRVDANAAWDADAAGAALEGLASIEVDLVEQPLAAGDLAGHAALRGAGVDVALDESVREHGVAGVVAADAADAVVLKPMALGGVGRAAEAAAVARDAGLDVVVTTTVDAVVARTAAVHLAAALDPDRACGLATASWLARDLAADPAEVVDGAVTVPQSAGLGVGVEDLA